MAETTDYCKVCGHPKAAHDLNVHLDPSHAKQLAEQGKGACHEKSFDDNACICFEYESWV